MRGILAGYESRSEILTPPEEVLRDGLRPLRMTEFAVGQAFACTLQGVPDEMLIKSYLFNASITSSIVSTTCPTSSSVPTVKMFTP